MERPPVSLILIFSILILVPGVLGDPTSHIDEIVTADFYMNGTLKNSVQRIGSVSVSIENRYDVLQYIELNLTGTSGSDLNSIVTHRSTAASPQITDKTSMYVNTTTSGDSLFYYLDDSVSPLVNISMSYSNRDGGIDIHSGTNTFDFVFDVTADRDLNDVTFAFQTQLNNYGNNDAMNIINPTMTGLSRHDTDGDGTYDRLEWDGNLNDSDTLTIQFSAEAEPGINFDEMTFTTLDPSGECGSYYSDTDTFTGIHFQNRFSRGPVRQGIEIADEGNWTVRGFMRNMAQGITYEVDRWDLYEVGSSSPSIGEDLIGNNETLYPGQTIQTDKFNTQQSDKIYYQASFDWEIKWGSSFYSAESNSTIDMPLFYFIQTDVDKLGIIDRNNENGRIIIINDTLEHLGSTETDVDLIYINSTIPRLSQEGSSGGFSISGISVVYSSGGNETDITNSSSISFSNPTSSSDGYVNILVTDSDIGNTMETDDEIILHYILTGPSREGSESFVFRTNSLVYTESGTPEESQEQITINIPGLGGEEEPAGGGGGGGGGPSEDVWIMKEDAKDHIIVGNLAEIEVTFRVYDTGNKGLRETGLMVFIPQGGEMIEERTKLNLMIEGSWRTLNIGTDYEIDYMGSTDLGDSKYNQYIFRFMGEYEELELHNQDKIKIKYQSELVYGLNDVITEASGYNYYRDVIIKEQVHSLIRIKAKIGKFSYTEKDWEQGEAVVGKPVMWLKEIKLKNPNDVEAEDSFVLKVFEDALSAKVVGETGEEKKLNIVPGSKVSWGVRMDANEEKTFYLQVFTPPTLEIWRSLEPILSNESWVNFDLYSEVKNFAREKYTNITYVLPNPRENILDYENIKYILPRGENQTSLILGDITPFENISFYVRYMQKPPILIINTNGFNFTNQDLLDLSAIVIPTEKEEEGYLELEIIGPNKKKMSVYGDAENIFGQGGSLNFVNRTISLESFSPGEYIILAKFKKDFSTILTEEKQIKVVGGGILFEIGYHVLLLALAIFILVMFIRIQRKKDKFKEELERLRRKL